LNKQVLFVAYSVFVDTFKPTARENLNYNIIGRN